MPLAEHTELLTPEAAVRQADQLLSPNGLHYGRLAGSSVGSSVGPPVGPSVGSQVGRVGVTDPAHASPAELARLVGTVPAALSAALSKHVYLFVPLALSAARLNGDESGTFSASDRTLIAPDFDAALVEKSICHRNASIGGTEYVFLSARLHNDRFALAFEFFINIAHNFVDAAGVPETFADLVWTQAHTGVRGETSIDAWEQRNEALGLPPQGDAEPHRRGPAVVRSPKAVDEKARTGFQSSAFADTLAIYLLSIFLDFDYADLREREYPLIAPAALADRLRAVNALFPANDGYKFEILYRKRG